MQAIQAKPRPQLLPPDTPKDKRLNKVINDNRTIM